MAMRLCWLVAVGFLVTAPLGIAAQVAVEDIRELDLMSKVMLVLQSMFTPSTASDGVVALYAYDGETVCRATDRILRLNEAYEGKSAIIRDSDLNNAGPMQAVFYPTIEETIIEGCDQLMQGTPWPRSEDGAPALRVPSDPLEGSYIAADSPLFGLDPERQLIQMSP